MPKRRPLLAAPEYSSKERTCPSSLKADLDTIVQYCAVSSTLLSVGANPRFVGDDPTGTTKTIEDNSECGFLC